MNRPETLFTNAVALHQSGKLDEAEKLYRLLLHQDENHTPTLNMLGILLHAKGNSKTALQLLHQSIEHNPNPYIASNNIGIVFRDCGDIQAAIKHFKTAIQLNSEYPDAHYNLANGLRSLGDTEGARENYQAALRLQPTHLGARTNLGNLYIAQHQYTEAITILTEAINLQLNNADIYNNLGLALAGDNRPSEAILQFKEAIKLSPHAVDAYNNLGNLYAASGDAEQAISAFKKALKIAPDCQKTCYNYSRILQQTGQLDASIVYAKKAISLAPTYSQAYSNLIFTMQYSPATAPANFLKTAKQWSTSFSRDTVTSIWSQTADASRRLKIGYVSGDLSSHPVGYFLAPVLANHDAEHVETFCYSNKPQNIEDEMSAHLRHSSDHWRNISGLSDDELAKLISNDKIDILVDLSGHTGGNRLPLFARRVAPLQIGWMGSCATTGLDTMDYLLADETVVPKEDDPLYTEKIWRLAQNYLCFSPPSIDINITEKRSQSPHVVFGCYNNPAKVTDEALSLWAQILAEVPNSEIIFRGTLYKSFTVQDRIYKHFASLGIDPDRISIFGSSERTHFLASYNEIDIALDPFPFGGGATTAEALWMGVPVISLRSDRWAGRVSDSILKSIGQPDWVATETAEYVTKAVKLANDSERRASLKGSLREQVINSPLCDGRAFTTKLETAYRDIWHLWCRDQQ